MVETEIKFAREFTEKKFYCDASKMGFVYQDDTIVKTTPGLWADEAGLRVGDQIVRIQTDYNSDPVVPEVVVIRGEKYIINYTPFGPLSQREKILRLKRKGGVGFIVTRQVQDDDLTKAAVGMQAAFRGKKARKMVQELKANEGFDADARGTECICFKNTAKSSKPQGSSGWKSGAVCRFFGCAPSVSEREEISAVNVRLNVQKGQPAADEVVFGFGK